MLLLVAVVYMKSRIGENRIAITGYWRRGKNYCKLFLCCICDSFHSFLHGTPVPAVKCVSMWMSLCCCFLYYVADLVVGSDDSIVYLSTIFLPCSATLPCGHQNVCIEREQVKVVILPFLFVHFPRRLTRPHFFFGFETHW